MTNTPDTITWESYQVPHTTDLFVWEALVGDFILTVEWQRTEDAWSWDVASTTTGMGLAHGLAVDAQTARECAETDLYTLTK